MDKYLTLSTTAPNLLLSIENGGQQLIIANTAALNQFKQTKQPIAIFPQAVFLQVDEHAEYVHHNKTKNQPTDDILELKANQMKHCDDFETENSNSHSSINNVTTPRFHFNQVDVQTYQMPAQQGLSSPYNFQCIIKIKWYNHDTANNKNKSAPFSILVLGQASPRAIQSYINKHSVISQQQNDTDFNKQFNKSLQADMVILSGYNAMQWRNLPLADFRPKYIVLNNGYANDITLANSSFTNNSENTANTETNESNVDNTTPVLQNVKILQTAQTGTLSGTFHRWPVAFYAMRQEQVWWR